MALNSLLSLITLVTLVSCDVNLQESSSVPDRLTLMEQQLNQQNDVIQQLRQQNDVQAVLENLNHRFYQQDVKLFQQDAKLSKQKDKLSQQDHIIKQQEAKLFEQEKVIRQQGFRLSQQDRIISKLLTNNIIPAASTKSTTPKSLHEEDSMTSETSTHHDIIARSDDTGAVGVVVNEMNQRVTQMSAAIQALKNTDIKHDSDIQALNAFHTSDIQALKASQATDIHALTLTNQHQDQDIHDARSSSFVRWGSSHCPHNSSLVYSGFVGGSLYSHTGAAANYLCLTMSPVFGSDRSTTFQALLYGGEYETGDSNQNRDAVCAVCRASFSTTIMIPGTNVCTSGWTLLYSGYLMAGDNVDKATEFVCVDAALESRAGTVHDDNGRLFYFTKTRCGSLPCGPYVNDKVVTCVVCGR